jgi:hypothetical protein
MPTGVCPECGCKMHVRPLDVEEWHRQHPQHRAGDRFDFKCPGCGFALEPGSRVSVRSVPQELAGYVAPGAFGTVTAVEGEGESGARSYIVEVPSPSGERLPARFTRRQLTWLGRE